MSSDAKKLAIGSWPFILEQLGIEVPDSPLKHGPCPGCGGVDRFRFDDKDGRGTFICGGGGDLIAGDGFDLLQHVFGYGFEDALKAVRGSLERYPAVLVQRRRPKPKRTGQRTYGLELWAASDKSDAAVQQHPYCQKKQIRHAFGAGVTGEQLVIPIRENGTGKVISVQRILPDGDKRTYGAMDAGFLLLGNDLSPDELYVVEGWADAWGVLRTYPAQCCGIAFGIGRLRKVAETLQARFPDHDIHILRDGGK